MAPTQRQPEPAPDTRTPFQKFDALARRVFTIPKSEVDKRDAKAVKAKDKRKR